MATDRDEINTTPLSGFVLEDNPLNASMCTQDAPATILHLSLSRFLRHKAMGTIIKVTEKRRRT